MSWDQTLLYRSCRAIIDGVCPPWLARRKVGGVSHARWLTTAIRINFLYMSMTSPTPEVTRLATFVVTIYACLWFQCKRDWQVIQAGKIVFNAMREENLCSKEGTRIGVQWGSWNDSLNWRQQLSVHKLSIISQCITKYHKALDV